MNKRIIGILVGLCFSLVTFAQTTTRGEEETKPVVTNTKSSKIVIVPYEYKLYLSTIDHNINKETKYDAKRIKHEIREGLDEQLYKALKQSLKPQSIIDDTAKGNIELKVILAKRTLSYDVTPDQNKYKAPVKEKEEKKINHGELTVAAKSKNRFMNCKAKPELIPYLNGKYKAQYYLFINQLDMVSIPPEEIGSNETYTRKITLHYTVFNSVGVEINSGTTETRAEYDVNTPDKIAKKYFSELAKVINDRIVKAITPKAK